jgi:hypothetical protein
MLTVLWWPWVVVVKRMVNVVNDKAGAINDAGVF